MEAAQGRDRSSRVLLEEVEQTPDALEKFTKQRMLRWVPSSGDGEGRSKVKSLLSANLTYFTCFKAHLDRNRGNEVRSSYVQGEFIDLLLCARSSISM